MIDLGNFDGDNYGSFWRLRLAKVSPNLPVLQPNQSALENDIEDLFSDIVFTAETGKFTFDLRQSADGAYYANRLVFDIPKFRREVIDWLNILKNSRLVALIDTQTSGQIFIGDAEHPLKFTAKHDGGEQVKSFNHFQCQLIGDSILPGIPFEDGLPDFDASDFEPLDFLTP